MTTIRSWWNLLGLERGLLCAPITGCDCAAVDDIVLLRQLVCRATLNFRLAICLVLAHSRSATRNGSSLRLMALRGIHWCMRQPLRYLNERFVELVPPPNMRMPMLLLHSV